MEDSLPLMIYQFLDVMYNHIIYQGMYVAALIGLIVSAWGLFLPLNKSEKEKEKKVYPFMICYGFLMISTVLFVPMKYEGYHNLYHNGMILFMTIAGIVILAKFLERLYKKHNELDWAEIFRKYSK
ncbi:MAG: hypothetical protein IIA82_10085 [Thaumarchaeota archaeon]|nr:hypothetical protein [Nitrososphaerota archaeon]